MSEPNDLVSISAYAAEKGVTKQAISKAVDKFVAMGLLETRRDGRSVVFSRAAFERAKGAATDPARELATDMARGTAGALFAPGQAAAPPPPPAPPVDDPYRAAAGEEKIAKARKAHLELQQLEGTLVDRDKVVRAQTNAARAVRNAVLGACGTAADRIAALPDPKDARAVKATLQTTMKEALTALADAMPKWKGAEDASLPEDD